MKKLGVSLLVGLTFAMLLFGCGKEKAEELLKKYNADGLFVDDSDHVWMTEGMKERFQLLKDTYSIGE